MSQWENIEQIERRLWRSADTLRSNSSLASNEYFLPVMGLIFLRHAHNRFLMVLEQIEDMMPKRGGKSRPLTKEDFSGKSAIFLQSEARFEYLVGLTDEKDRAAAIIHAMQSIENDYENLKGVLPKSEYQELDNDVLKQLLTIFNDHALVRATGDVFGRIYEYFLTQFADQGAHDGGEFFTPTSLVQMIVNVIEPKKGKVLDPACGSGGMFVQSAHFIENQAHNPNEYVTFYGIEKNATTIRLAKMNLAVHGLEGNIQQALTYYKDPHGLLESVDYVMANPPFNVDEVDPDKETVRSDPRLPFGLPGISSKTKKISNGNYLWIQYFYSYLSKKGRSGFVMSSQASSAGSAEEKKIRQRLVETGHVDAMMAIRSNFFYTRSVPCELWFFNKAKSSSLKDTVLMIDARNISRKVTQKIHDFSPEQMQNLSSIVWLYRGESDRFWDLVRKYLKRSVKELNEIAPKGEAFNLQVDEIYEVLGPYISLVKDSSHLDAFSEFSKFSENIKNDLSQLISKTPSASGIIDLHKEIKPLADSCTDLIKDIDLACRQLNRFVADSEKMHGESDDSIWPKSEFNSRGKNNRVKQLDVVRHELVEQLKLARYFHRQAEWLLERFPEGKVRDVEGLVKVVSKKEIEANDWSLTPGRYVGVATEEDDEDFDFEEELRAIHLELQELNDEAQGLASQISRNFEELGV